MRIPYGFGQNASTAAIAPGLVRQRDRDARLHDEMLGSKRSRPQMPLAIG
jgi:hypothetical protein